MTLSACTLVKNAAEVAGSGIYVTFTPTELERVIIAFGQGTAAFQCGDTDYIPTLSCCDIYGNVAGDRSACVVDQLGVAGNISVNPLFCDITNGDFTLRADSPCAAENSSGCGQIGSWPVACGDVSSTHPSMLLSVSLLIRNHPNPFNPATQISYRLPAPTVVTIRVFDLGGRVFRTLSVGVALSEGFHSIGWNGYDDHCQPLLSGAYFCRLDAAGQTQTQKMLLVK